MGMLQEEAGQGSWRSRDGVPTAAGAQVLWKVDLAS